MTRPKIGLVLGGGGARGLAHVGVIGVLEEAGIPIDYIAGCSMGALIGGVYAQNPDAALLKEKVTRFIKGPKFKQMGVDNFKQKAKSDPDDLLTQLVHHVKRRVVINLAANRVALLKANRLNVAVENLLEDSNIEDCKIPFACVAADLISGEEVIFKKGPIYPAVEGSSAIPGFIPPMDYDGYSLIDGSIVNNFPVDVVREMGAEFVITVSVSLTFDEALKADNVIDIVMRSSQITSRKLTKLLEQQADYVLKPDIGNVHWSEFVRVDELITQGESTAKKSLPELEELLPKRKSWLSRLLKPNQ